MIVYKITNSVNGKAYIGLTTRTLRIRRGQHIRDARTGKYPLHQAMRKYGVSVFVFEELLRCDSIDDLNTAECQQIVLHRTRIPNGYNITAGGRGTVGRITSPVVCAAKSAQLKRVHAQNPMIRVRISEGLKAFNKAHSRKVRKHSPESIARIRDSAVARYAISGNREKLLAMATMSGQRPRTDKQRAHTARMAHDPDVRAQARAAQACTIHDPSRRAAWLQGIRVAQLATWQRRRDASPNGSLPQMGNHANAVRGANGQFAKKVG